MAKKLWDLPDSMTVKTGQTKKMTVKYADDSGAKVGGKNVVQPNTGDGSLVSSGGSLSVKSFTAAARSAEIELENTGAVDAEVTTLEVNGDKITSFDKQTVFEENASSITTYGLRELTIEAELLDSEEQARTVARYILGQRETLAGVVRGITLLNKTDAMQAVMLEREIGDRIRITEDQTEHDGEYHIIGEEHSLKQGCKHHTVTWALERADTQQYWVVGVSRVGIDTRVGY